LFGSYFLNEKKKANAHVQGIYISTAREKGHGAYARSKQNQQANN
jgi:hypothetical protein